MGEFGARLDAQAADWELFDLQNDPLEMKNLYRDPAHSEVVKEMKAELKRLREELDEQTPVLPI